MPHANRTCNTEAITHSISSVCMDESAMGCATPNAPSHADGARLVLCVCLGKLSIRSHRERPSHYAVRHPSLASYYHCVITNAPCGSLCIAPSARAMQHGSCNIGHAARVMQHGPCSTGHATWVTQHGPCSMVQPPPGRAAWHSPHTAALITNTRQSLRG